MSAVRGAKSLYDTLGPINEYEIKIATKLWNYEDSWLWLGLHEIHIKTLQNFQDEFIMKWFQV